MDASGKTPFEESEIKEADLREDMVLARMIVARISSKVHPEKFVKNPGMYKAAEKLNTLLNRIINRLKGLS